MESDGELESPQDRRAYLRRRTRHTSSPSQQDPQQHASQSTPPQPVAPSTPGSGRPRHSREVHPPMTPRNNDASANDDDDDDDEEEEEEEGDGSSSDGPAPSKRIKLVKKDKLGCKACGSREHRAGFVGATYFDCPDRPCFLCKKTGHTTENCAFRVQVGQAVRRPALNLAKQLFSRENDGSTRCSLPVSKWGSKNWRLVQGIRSLHGRRITTMLWHPTKTDVLISADKQGELSLWNRSDKLDVSHMKLHLWLVYAMELAPNSTDTLVSVGADGAVFSLDLPSLLATKIYDINPIRDRATWRTLNALTVNHAGNMLLAGDDVGNLHAIDPRQPSAASVVQCHKAKNKINGLHTNPADNHLFLSCSNDYTAALWDDRRIETRQPLAVLPHKRVVNSAYFSPVSGCKILTTCQDNRVRVFDYVRGDLQNPSRKIVHSHDFNRYLSPFKCVWDPKDTSESLAVVGRYISEEYAGVPLHPIDIFDVSSGELLSTLMDTRLQTICPVNVFHPTENVLATGSSGSVYLWSVGEAREFREDMHGGASGGGRGSNSKKKTKAKLVQAQDIDIEVEELEEPRSRKPAGNRRKK